MKRAYILKSDSEVDRFADYVKGSYWLGPERSDFWNRSVDLVADLKHDEFRGYWILCPLNRSFARAAEKYFSEMKNRRKQSISPTS